MSISYNDWLKMTPEEQGHLHFEEWDVYGREGYPIALMAAARFAEQSPKKIYHSAVGTYHGGEYVLHMYVSDEDFPSCPKRFEQSFEGFRILWQPIGPRRWDMDPSPKLEGNWHRENNMIPLKISVDTKSRPYRVAVNYGGDPFTCKIEEAKLENCEIQFEAANPVTGIVENHSLSPLTPERCFHSVTYTEVLHRS